MVGAVNASKQVLVDRATGNVYAFGTVARDNGSGGFVHKMQVVRFNKDNGSKLFGEETEVGSTAGAMALHQGKLYLTGGTTGSSLNVITMRVDALTGNRDWTQELNVVAQQNDFGHFISATASGVYVGAVSRTQQPMSTDSAVAFGVIKYSHDGTFVWANDRAARNNSAAGGLVVDEAAGSVYMAATEPLSDSDKDISVCRRSNATGDVQWFTMFNGPLNGAESALAIVVDPTGDVVVAGKGSMDR